MSKLSHLLNLIIILQYKEFTTASELADILEVDKKTIYRYINTLQMSNIPIEIRKGRNGGFYINKNFYMRYPGLEIKELEALIMASKILTKENGFLYAPELQNAVTKIKNTCLNYSKEFCELEENISSVFNESRSLESFNDVMSKINTAMSKGRILKIVYDFNNGEIETEISPYSIFFKDGKWCLIAYCNVKEKEVIFDISKIKELELTRDIFIKSKNFNMAESLSNLRDIYEEDTVNVKIKFSKKSEKHLIKNEWNLIKNRKYLSNGNVIFKIRKNELEAMKRWILGFGADAEVLEPLELRSEIKEEMGKIIEKY